MGAHIQPDTGPQGPHARSTFQRPRPAVSPSAAAGQRLGAAEDLAGLIAASQRTAVVVEAQQIIGFARAITDGISNGYLSMVVVAEPFRRQGVGQALIQHIVGEEESITWVLRAGREGAPEFFAKLGFVESTVGMELKR